MSGTAEALDRRIAGAQDLQGVVRSMKALAASSIDQYEKAVESLADYSRTVQLGLSVCLRPAQWTPPRSEPRGTATRPIGAILFGSDQGLVGRFNEVLLEFALAALRTSPGQIKRIWAVGDRIRTLAADTALPAPSLLSVPSSVDAIAPLVGQLLIEIETARERGEVLDVYLFHNQPRAAPVYAPVSARLLPLDAEWERSLLRLPWPTRCLPEVMQGECDPALPGFLREYLFVLLFQACAQSLASENASRLASMQRAEKNIQDILEDLGRRARRQRQESIDEELLEVISGYEALLPHRASGAAPRAADVP